LLLQKDAPERDLLNREILEREERKEGRNPPKILFFFIKIIIQ
jgi:hypothetical protein